MMNILLIGKFPPCQGGVASKYYWLFSSLLARKKDFQFRAITIAKQPYTTMLPDNVASMVKIIDADCPGIPWFIPKSDLFVDQIVSIAMQLAESVRFDLIICNYLAPYLAATYIIAKLLSLPYQVYPAGSDTHKLLPCRLTSSALDAYLQNAAAVFMPKEKITSFRAEHRAISPCHVKETDRYVPNPSAFYSRPHQNNDFILLCGKINKYWRLRGINKLCQLLCANHGVRLKCIIQGAYCDEFKKELMSQVSASQLEFIDRFISPAAVPEVISSSIGVWNYLGKGGIVDFPNTHWETIYSARISFCSDYLLRQPDSQKTVDLFGKFIVNVDTKDWPLILSPCQETAIVRDNLEEKKRIYFERYIERHYLMFKGDADEH